MTDRNRVSRRAPATLLVTLLLTTCSPDAPTNDSRSDPSPSPWPIRLADAPDLVVTQPDAPARTLWELQRGALDDAWMLRQIPNTTLYEEVAPRFDAGGALLLPLQTDGAPTSPLYEQLYAEHAGGEVGRGVLAVLVEADPGAELEVVARIRKAATGKPARRTLLVLELDRRPSSTNALMEDFARDRALAVHTVEEERGGTARARFSVRPDAGVVVILAGPSMATREDVVVEELLVRDTGGRTLGADPLTEVVADDEARAAVVLGDGGSLAVDLPTADVPTRVELGVATLFRPDRARVQLRLEGRNGERRELLSETLKRPSRAGKERWTDLVADVPGGASGRLVVAVSSLPPGGAVAVAVEAPRLLDGSNRATPERPNVILLSIDTLRADALTRNGGHPDATPALDAFAARAVAFDACVAPAPYTLPSHVTMLSGQQPTVHGVVAPGRAIVVGRTRLLAEILREEGFLTTAFTAGGYLHRRFGFSRGFDRYGHRDEMFVGRDDHLTWIDAHADQRFFLFLHTYTAHATTRLKEPYLSRFDGDCDVPELHGPERHARLLGAEGLAIDPSERGHFERCYVGAVRQADDQVALLMERLAANDLLDDTIVIVVSDHGEELGERGMFGHAHSLYDELVMVPLMISGPGSGAPGRVVDDVVGVADVAPTVLDLLGLPVPPGVQGRSLAPLLDGRTLPERGVIAEVDATVHRYALRWDGGKVILDPGSDADGAVPAWELFDLAADPEEQRNLVSPGAARPDVAQAEQLQRLLDDWQRLADDLDRAFGEGEHELSGEEIERLKELGYLGG